MVAQREGVVRDRYDGEGGDCKGKAEPQQSIAQKPPRRLMGKAWPYKQSGEKKEHRHEEAVGGEHDGVKAES